MDSNISTYTGNYQIRAYEIDMHKRCTPPALIQIMHEASLMHTIKLGVSVWDLEKQKISWVLRSMHIEINRLPLLNESIKLLTYPSGYQRMFTYRDYYVYDQDDILIASSKTKWVLMDTEQRKFTPFPEAMKALIQLEGKQTLPIPNDKIKKIDIKDYSHRFVVNWYDLDFNQHLNNIVYIKWALQSLSNEVLSKQLLNIRVVFKREAVLNDEVMSHSTKIANNMYQHQLMRASDQEILLIAESTWK